MAMARAFFEFVKIQVHKAFGNLVPLKCRMKKIHFQVRQRGGQMGQACKAERPDLIQRRVIQPAPMLKNSFLLVQKTTQMIWVGEVMPAFNLDSKLNFIFLQSKKKLQGKKYFFIEKILDFRN